MDSYDENGAAKKGDFLCRLIANSMTFLTLREKKLFYERLADSNSIEKDFLAMTIDDVSFAVKRGFSRVQWNPSEILRCVRLAEKIIGSLKIDSTCTLDSDFPAMLREMKDPPFMLFYRGNLETLKRKCVSVVGTRKASNSALKAAMKFSQEACDDGRCVISGLAFGIDGAAHKGALLSQNSATAAILPSGIDMITPSSHTKLAQKILERQGLVMSEYLPGTPSLQFRYVQRNRIVAALSPATVVIQAPGGSGAMITADLALGYNREVFFHKECFSPEAGAINQLALAKLKSRPLTKRQIESKIESTPKRYVEDGAKVISSYADFKAFQGSARCADFRLSEKLNS